MGIVDVTLENRFHGQPNADERKTRVIPVSAEKYFHFNWRKPWAVALYNRGWRISGESEVRYTKH